jgi:hypothetical protein
MQMIWHYNKFIKNNIGMVIRNFPPKMPRHTAGHGQPHHAIFDFPEMMCPIFSANSNKIQPQIPIIPVF